MARLPVALAALTLLAAAGLADAGRAEARAELPQCADNIDNDGDGKIDWPFEPGCTSFSDDSEPDPATLPACSDKQDSSNAADGDTVADFPGDWGCTSAIDTSEDNTGPVPACGNGSDNDMDRKIDWPADPGCSWAAETNEDDTECSNGIDDDRDGKIDAPADFGCITTSASALAVNDATEADLPQCNDGRDNDGDGLVDTDQGDPDCSSATDDSEAPPPKCSDGIDNDGDGVADFPLDRGCTFAGDNDETDPVPPRTPQCSDEQDNDGDDAIDLLDQGCSSPTDDDETNTQVVYVLPAGPVTKKTPLLAPFPVVRLSGRVDPRGVRITLLTVRSAYGSTITVLCSGAKTCPTKKLTIKARRRITHVSKFEKRTLKAGTTLRIFVTKNGFVGKYTRFKFARNRAPFRVDRCAKSATTLPLPCPTS